MGEYFKAINDFGQATLEANAELSLLSWASHLIAVWLLGITLGWLLPRPKFAKRGFNAKNVFMLTAPGLWLRRTVAFWNGLLLLREVWYLKFSPGTFRSYLRAAWTSITTGQLTWPSRAGAHSADSSSPTETAAGTSTTPADPINWYVTTTDLEFCRDAIDRDVGPVWEEMFTKDFPRCCYTAWRRTLPNGKTEYKSVTVSEDSTAEEFMDFYLDDDTRPKWDGMISEHQLLEAAHDFNQHRCQVVRWVRSFPFAFISRREYVIARRLFKNTDNGALYGITKGIDHPAAPPADGLVRMSTFYSMWRSRTVSCPRGSDRPACETTLLHFEDFGIPENLARFAVRHGMAGFISKMVPFVRSFVDARRERCDPFQLDADAYGSDLTPAMDAATIAAANAKSAAFANLHNGLDRSASDASIAAAIVTDDENCFVDDSASERSGLAPRRSSSMRGLGYMIVASGVALALSRVGSSGALLESRSAAAAAAAAKARRARVSHTTSKDTSSAAGAGVPGGAHPHIGHRIHGEHAHRVHKRDQKHHHSHHRRSSSNTAASRRQEGLRSHKVATAAAEVDA